MVTKNYDYGVIGNGTSSALISADASIDWLCLPYFDSPSLFAKILDDKNGGHFKIEGVETLDITQEYLPNTPILKTIIKTKDGILEVRDYMPRFMTAREQYYCPSEIHRDLLVSAWRETNKFDATR